MRLILTTVTLAGLSVTIASAANPKAGKAVYERACKSCHGPDGEGNPAVAKMKKVEIKDLKSPDVHGMSDEDMKMIVTKGKGKMPAVTSVSGGDLENVIAYVKSLKK